MKDLLNLSQQQFRNLRTVDQWRIVAVHVSHLQKVAGVLTDKIPSFIILGEATYIWSKYGLVFTHGVQPPTGFRSRYALEWIFSLYPPYPPYPFSTLVEAFLY